MEESLQIEVGDYLTVKDINQIKSKLKIDLRNSIFPIKYTHHKYKYMYALCRHKGCEWKLSYKYSVHDEVYLLKQHHLNHNHQYNLLSNQKSEFIENFIKNLPNQLTVSAAKAIVQQHLRISLSSFYYYYKKVRFPSKSMIELMRQMDKRNYWISVIPYELIPSQLPDLLVIVTPLMKQNYYKYGKDQFCSFDFTFNLIKEHHSQNESTYKLGCIVGLSNCRKIVPYALVIVDRETKDRYYEVIKNFSLTMQCFSKIFITDESLAMVNCAKQFEQSQQLIFFHALDIFHILRNVRKKLIRKDLLSIFAQLAKCQNELEFEYLLERKYEQFDHQTDRDTLNKFVQQAHSYCFSQMPYSLFGFVSSDSPNEKIHDLIKTKIPTQRSYTQVVALTLQLLDKMGKNCHDFKLSKLQIQMLYNYPYLKELRYCVDQRILKEITKQLQLSLLYQLIDKEQQYEILTEKRLKFIIESKDKYVCRCRFIDKVGIPCSHLMKLFMIKQMEFKDYIHPRWLIEGNIEKEEKKQEKRGRGRTTRRK